MSLIACVFQSQWFPQTKFNDVRMLRAVHLKKASEWTVGVRRDSGWNQVKASSLLHLLVYHNVQTEVSDGMGGN